MCGWVAIPQPIGTTFWAENANAPTALVPALSSSCAVALSSTPVISREKDSAFMEAPLAFKARPRARHAHDGDVECEYHQPAHESRPEVVRQEMRALRNPHETERRSRGDTAPQARVCQGPIAEMAAREIERDQREAGGGVAAWEAVTWRQAGRRGFEQREVRRESAELLQPPGAVLHAGCLESPHSEGGQHQREREEQQQAAVWPEQRQHEAQEKPDSQAAGSNDDQCAGPLMPQHLEHGVMAKREGAGGSVEEPATDRRIDAGPLQRKQQQSERRRGPEVAQQEISARLHCPAMSCPVTSASLPWCPFLRTPE